MIDYIKSWLGLSKWLPKACITAAQYDTLQCIAHDFRFNSKDLISIAPYDDGKYRKFMVYYWTVK